MLRKTLGWLDEEGEPIQERFRFTFDELQERAGVGRDAISEALEEAEKGRFIRVVQRPQKKAQGVSGRSGVYELRWDAENYTDRPEAFAGFYEKGSYINPAGEPRFSRKNIPNAFFDIVIKREKLSVIRVVGALLFYSIQWGKGGERKTPVRKSKRELGRLARIDPSNASRAIAEAIQAKYIERVECGVFDFSSNQENKATLFGIRWTRSFTYTPDGELQMIAGGAGRSPVNKGLSETSVGKRTPDDLGHQSENAPRPKKTNSRKMHPGEQSVLALPNSRFSHSEKQSENAPYKEVKLQRAKTDKRTKTTTAPNGAHVVVENENQEIIQLLRKQGIENSEAKRLMTHHSEAIIKKQIEWLPLRNPKQNPAGLLRVCIERDLPPPHGTNPKLPTSVVPGKNGAGETESPAHIFAAHFYAGYHGNEGKPIAPPSTKDVDAAQGFVSRLDEISPQAKADQVATWGRDFGKFVKEQQRFNAPGFVSFTAAIRSLGDGFFSRLKNRVDDERRRARYQAVEKAQEVHEKRHRKTYFEYLKGMFTTYETQYPDAISEFEKERTRKVTGGGFFNPSSETRKKLDTGKARLEAFQVYFQGDEEAPVLDFWGWDEKHNSQPFDEESVSV